jgi:hypothetical protein
MAAAAGAGAAAPQAGAAAQVVGPFSLFPSAVDNQVLDYSTKEGMKKFEKAVAKLNNMFEGKSEQMTVFKGDLEMRATNSGWNNGMADADVIAIPTIANPAISHNLIHAYSQLSNEDIIAWATAEVIGQQNRKAQNNANMYQCLYNSLSSTMVNKMLLESEKYNIQGTLVAALYYKCIMGHSNVDTLATISLTRHMLATLDTKMIDVNSNIDEFNVYVQELRNKLTRYGTTSEDMLVNLFRGYKAAADRSFHQYILDIERDYQYGDRVLTAEELMTKALTAYQVEKEKGAWGALSDEQQQLIAMQSEIKQLKDSKLKLQKKGNKNSNKNSNKNKKKNEPKTESSKYAWKDKAPKSGGPKTKQWSGKTYHWCTNHNDGKGKWVLHKPSECNLRSGASQGTTQHQAAAATADDADSSITSASSRTRTGTTFAAAAAAAAIRELEDDEE